MSQLREICYPTGWIRKGNVLVYPDHWQLPAATEKWASDYLLKVAESNSNIEYVCFPWATFIDLSMHGARGSANDLVDALRWVPPHYARRRATVCQHIYARSLFEKFIELGITDLFWSHKTADQHSHGGISFHPFPLYPVNFIEHHSTEEPPKRLDERQRTYSFIGAYNPDIYLSEVRKFIFELPELDGSVIQKRNEWHFESHVYDVQVRGATLSENQRAQIRKNEQVYGNTMADSIFCLCPSGSGPNSIRIWEAILYGCVPVILSDKLHIPDIEDLDKVFILCEESRSAVQRLPEYLLRLGSDHGFLSERQRYLEGMSEEAFLKVLRDLN